jgi:SulP family sulfate permease
MVGVAQMVMGLARLGVLVNFVSDSVIIGFSAGAGILIGANQLRHLFGLDLPSTAEFYLTVWELVRHLSETHFPSLGLGLGTVILILLLRRFRPRWPGALIGLLVASGLVVVLGLDQAGVVVLGELPSGLPVFTRLPIFNLPLIGKLSTGALAVAAMGLIESMSTARSLAAKSGQRLDSNQEFVGRGLANLVSGFSLGMLVRDHLPAPM